MNTCRLCSHWAPPKGSQRYGECSFLAIHPATRKVMPEAQIPLKFEAYEGAVYHLRTTSDFAACKGFIRKLGAK